MTKLTPILNFLSESIKPVQRKYSCVFIKRELIAITVACTLFGCEQPNKQEQQNPVEIRQEKPQTAESNALESRLQLAGLVDIQTIDSNVIVDLKYSSTDNFVGVDVYGELDRCYLQPEVADMLAVAQQELNRQLPGYRLLLYDCVRPLSVQQILWDTLQKPEEVKPLYVADPKKGSIHNYGSAVDLTIADPQGQPLDMGTGYDYFGELAYPTKEDELLASGVLTREQVANRELLRAVMSSAGFTGINSEWWHFNAYSRKRAAELFDIVE
jgi:D-alanyl-D-alanine dipeptidase